MLFVVCCCGLFDGRCYLSLFRAVCCSLFVVCLLTVVYVKVVCWLQLAVGCSMCADCRLLFGNCRVCFV